MVQIDIGTSVDSDRSARLETDGGGVKRASPQFSPVFRLTNYGFFVKSDIYREQWHLL